MLDTLLLRPGVLVAWAAVVGVALAWIGTAIFGLAHGEFETGHDRFGYFLAVGNFSYAVALAVGLTALVLVPARPGSGGTSAGDDESPQAGVQAGDRLLLLVLGIGGLVVAAAALAVCISDLTEIGNHLAVSASDAVGELAAIPLGLGVALWARALLPSRPLAAVAPTPYNPAPAGPYGPYGPSPYGPPPGPAPQGAQAPFGQPQQPPYGQPGGSTQPSPYAPPGSPPPQPAYGQSGGSTQQSPYTQPGGPPQPPVYGQPQPSPYGPPRPPAYGQPGGSAEQPSYPPYGQDQTPPPYGQQSPPGYGGPPED
jgi:hypothetical protein